MNEDETNDDMVLLGGNWDRERWWYKLTHVCRRWRYLILDSAHYLGLRLLCTYGTPVADMLAHSPPLPLIVDHFGLDDYNITAEEEEGVLLALQHRDRVHRVRLNMPVPHLQRLVLAMDGEFPMLENLVLTPPDKRKINTSLALPKEFQAPHLRHLILVKFASPIGSALLMTGVGLVTLSLDYIYPSTYFRPNSLVVTLSLMPQLEILGISFHSSIPIREFERQLLQTPVRTHATLPHLRWFAFRGDSAYLEALLPQMTTPLLEKLQVIVFNQLTLSIPCLLHFMNAAANLKFTSAEVTFDDFLNVRLYPPEGAALNASFIQVECPYLELQVAVAVQISDQLRAILSPVVYLTFKYRAVSSLSGDGETERTQWREILRSFSNVKTLRVPNALVWDLSQALRSADGESPEDLLPELKELEYAMTDEVRVKDAFGAFIVARQNSGRPITLLRG